jgi:hypothetical protein
VRVYNIIGVYIFVCGLFNNAVSISDCVASNIWVCDFERSVASGWEVTLHYNLETYSLASPAFILQAMSNSLSVFFLLASLKMK